MKKLAVVLCLLAPLAAKADEKPALTQYLNMRSTGAPSLSPDGSHSAFLWSVTGTAQVWVTRVENGFPEQLTSFEDRVTFVEWAPAGDRIFFGKDSGGNEKTQLYVMRPDGSGVEALTSNPKAIHQFGSVSRDGRWLAFAANDRDERIFDVHVMDLVSKQTRRVVAEDTPFNAGDFSPDGKFLLLQRQDHSRNNDVYVVEVATSKLTNLTPHEGDVRFFAGEWLPDGRSLYVVTDKGRDRLSLALLRMGNGAAKLEFVDTGNREVEGVAASWDGTYLAYTVNEDGYNRAVVLNRKTKRAVRLPKGQNVNAARFTADSKTVIFSTASGRELTERYLFDPASGKLTQIGSRATRGFPRIRWGSRSSFATRPSTAWRSRPGCTSRRAPARTRRCR